MSGTHAAAVLVFTAATCSAQTPPQAPTQPSSWVGAGAAYNRYATPATASGWISFAPRIANRTYSFSTMEMTPKASSIRTGFARILAMDGRWTMAVLGDAGIAAGGQVTLGSFSGGGMILYEIKNKFQVAAIVRMVSVTSTSTQSVFELGIGRSF